ncbi:MAG: hypothetical protein WD467_00055 [Candidatus Saccharimonadales bacterium]
MTNNQEPSERIQNSDVATSDVDGVLSDESVATLTGFLDVLIQMDLAQKQRNKSGDGNEIPKK